MLCYVMLCYVMLCYVMLCYVMLCYVMLCYVMFLVECFAAFQKTAVPYIAAIRCPSKLVAQKLRYATAHPMTWRRIPQDFNQCQIFYFQVRTSLQINSPPNTNFKFITAIKFLRPVHDYFFATNAPRYYPGTVDL